MQAGASPTHIQNPRHYRYYDLIMAGFVTVLLCSNIIGAGKSCVLELPFALPLIGSALVFGAGNIFFPISYIFGDVLTEVYGYARTRKVIWAGFAGMLFYVLMSQVVIHAPANPNDEYTQKLQPALSMCFGSSWRIVGMSILAFWVGDFVNSYVMAKMKVMTRGRFLWMRTIGSTMVGQAADSLIFYPLALANLQPLFISLGVTSAGFLAAMDGWNADTVFRIVLFNWGFKVAIEVLFTPLTYLVVNALKRAENEDYYDANTNFTPFSLKEPRAQTGFILPTAYLPNAACSGRA
jgi:uncharacterized integral membrane protein (TIGR00697 family)